MDYQEFHKREAELLSLLFRDGEPTPAARELYAMAQTMLVEQYRTSKTRKRTGRQKSKRKEVSIALVAIDLLREKPAWDDMLLEIPLSLELAGISVDQRTLSRILTTHRGTITAAAAA